MKECIRQKVHEKQRENIRLYSFYKYFLFN
jgi:hypothetical protein